MAVPCPVHPKSQIHRPVSLHIFVCTCPSRPPQPLFPAIFLLSYFPFTIKHLAPLSPRPPAVTPPPPPYAICHRYKPRASANHSKSFNHKRRRVPSFGKIFTSFIPKKALQRRVSTNGRRSSKDLDAIRLQIDDRETTEPSHNFTTLLTDV